MTKSGPNPAPKAEFLINRNFRLLFAGQGISLLGDQIFNFTLVVWIAAVIAKGQSWAPLAVSGLLIAAIVPSFLVGPLAGVFVDRWDRRTTMLRMDGLRAVLVSLLLLVANIVPLPFFRDGRVPASFQLIVIYAVVFCVSICSQFFSPSRFALVGDVVTGAQRAQASGLLQASQGLAVILGPPLAAPLLFSVGVGWALLINALSFVVSLCALAALHVQMATKPPQHRGVRGEFMRGLEFVLHQRSIRALLIASFILSLGIGAFDALYVFFLTQNLHASTRLLGFLGSALGAGAILGALSAGTLGNRVGAKRMLAASMILTGLLFMLLSRVTNLGLALVLIFLMGILQSAIGVSSAPIVLKETPKEMLGRVVSVLTPAGMIATLISAALSGYLVSSVLAGLHLHVLGLVFGPVDTIFSFGGILLALAGLYAGASFGWKKESAAVEQVPA